MKRLRKRIGKVRFFHCGEYGEQNLRPHYHALLFGYEFPDMESVSHRRGIVYYESKILDKLWGNGMCRIGEANFETAAYVARYITKKVTGQNAVTEDQFGLTHYQNMNIYTGEIYDLKPEYITMSRRPGIGNGWFNKYARDVYPHDYVVIERNKKMVQLHPPKYYDTLFQIDDPFSFDEVKFKRIQKAKAQHALYTPERLEVLEECAELRLKQLKRGFENDF